MAAPFFKWSHLPLTFVTWLLLDTVQEGATDIAHCNYEDTVNVTGSNKFANGSYLYEGVLIPAELIGVYDYEVLYGGFREPVGEHIRGCICELKSCVKFCCHPKAMKKRYTRECSHEMSDELNYSPYIYITLDNGSRQSMHVLDEFVVQQGIPCSDAYSLVPQEAIEDDWELFENGTLLRLFDMAYLTKRDYCLTPNIVNDSYVLNPLNCPVYYTPPKTQTLNSIAMLVSVPFLVLTILVYLVIPELRNLHGKCLVCYLISLALGYTLLAIITLSNVAFSDEVCSLLGFLGYFSFMAAFFWLSVISFDLWHNFRGTTCNVQRIMQKKRFCVYSLYAWGFPILLTVLTILSQLSDFKEILKPGIGGEYCWLKTDDWSAMLYFYGPNLLLILFNMTMFILTSLKIYKVKRELERIVAREEGTRHLGSDKDNYGLFLRLFIVMGVTWLLEVVSYMVGPQKLWSVFFYIPDLCNAAQGIFIFVLFVLKRKVKLLIIKRILRREKTSFGANSTQSDCSAEEMSLKDCPRGEVVQFVD